MISTQRKTLGPQPAYRATALWSLACVVLALSAHRCRAAVITPVASYEPSETDLVVTPGSGDAGLTVSIVPGGVNGAPPATDGTNVLKVDFVGEDGKVEFRHDWTTFTYDLANQDTLRADVYIETASAIPGIMGIWSPNWNPPDNWQPATGLPTQTGTWTTISIDVSQRTQAGLNQIWAFIFENMPGATGTAYVDNLRLVSSAGASATTGVAAVGFADRNEVHWAPSDAVNLDGYNVYRAPDAAGPFVQINTALISDTVYRDTQAAGPTPQYYQVTTVVGGVESPPSQTASAAYDGMTDDQLLTLIQQQTFKYFWDYGHPVSGMAREGFGFGHSSETVTTGGTGMGLLTIMVGAQRGFVTRSDAANRILQILTFLDTAATRYHGAWSHHMNGTTGATIPFSSMDDGGDLVETAFLVQGLLAVRQYFDDPIDPVETEIRTRATSMWEGVEWDWYRRFTGSNVLYWHWSPNFGWALNLPIFGYNEAMIVYLLAIASPTHPMPGSSYDFGWAFPSTYENPNTFYGFRQWVGPDMGGPLFFTHYSHLGFDPRFKRDPSANYFDNSRNITLINRAYCIDNPNGFAGYNPLVWGLTASFDPFGYSAHSPTNDNGTITPTAAISAMPYAPQESLAATRHMFDNFNVNIWGQYGFVDAFNPSQNWFAPGFIAIDEGTIVPMIENYRTGLCWKMFMSNAEIRPALVAAGWSFSADFDGDADIDSADYAVWQSCQAGPQVVTPPAGCSAADFATADMDGDGDVDLRDAGWFQFVFQGP